jgi:antitoxin component YwqK of YwqJK toxin-antitoxin module
MMSELNIAEIPYENGEIRFRYSRCMSPDGSRWIRHGLFRAYHQNGALASEGNYVDGVEHGPWRDYHENGQLAAEGQYEHGQENGKWRYWNRDGSQSLGNYGRR